MRRILGIIMWKEQHFPGQWYPDYFPLHWEVCFSCCQFSVLNLQDNSGADGIKEILMYLFKYFIYFLVIVLFFVRSYIIYMCICGVSVGTYRWHNMCVEAREWPWMVFCNFHLAWDRASLLSVFAHIRLAGSQASEYTWFKLFLLYFLYF